MSRLEFLANMNISPLTVKALRTLGWSIVRVPEIMDSKSKDVDILTYAREHNQVVITQDLDFSTLLALRGYEKPSVINLRFENAKPDEIVKSQYFSSLLFLRKQESSYFNGFWTPAFAGVTDF